MIPFLVGQSIRPQDEPEEELIIDKIEELPTLTEIGIFLLFQCETLFHELLLSFFLKSIMTIQLQLPNLPV